MYGNLMYQAEYRAQERERRLAHKHWSDLAPKRRERRWLNRAASLVHSEPKAQAAAPAKPKFA